MPSKSKASHAGYLLFPETKQVTPPAMTVLDRKIAASSRRRDVDIQKAMTPRAPPSSPIAIDDPSAARPRARKSSRHLIASSAEESAAAVSKSARPPSLPQGPPSAWPSNRKSLPPQTPKQDRPSKHGADSPRSTSREDPSAAGQRESPEPQWPIPGKVTGRRTRGDSINSRSTSAASTPSGHLRYSTSPLLGRSPDVPPRSSSRRDRRSDPKRYQNSTTASSPSTPDSGNVHRLRRKPVPQQLRPRPSSPTLHHSDFLSLSPPRSAPSVPRGVVPLNPGFPYRRSAIIVQPMSFWDLDSDEEEVGSDDGSIGLVGRMKSGFTLRRTSRENGECNEEKQQSKSREGTKGMQGKDRRTRRSSPWAEILLCC